MKTGVEGIQAKVPVPVRSKTEGDRNTELGAEHRRSPIEVLLTHRTAEQDLAIQPKVKEGTELLGEQILEVPSAHAYVERSRESVAIYLFFID